MFYKYYTADLMTLKSDDLQVPSITIKVWFFTNPIQVVNMMRNQLDEWDLDYHRMFNIRRGFQS